MPPISRHQRMRFRRNSKSDRLMDDLDLARKNIITDPNCLFRAVSENVYQSQRLYDKVRSQCVNYMELNKERFQSLVDGSFQEYVKELSSKKTYGGFTEISVMSHLYRRDFVVISNNEGKKIDISNNYENSIYLIFYKDFNHFDCLFKKEYLNDEGFCQSITYGIIYESVFNMSNVRHVVDKMLHNNEFHTSAWSKNAGGKIKECESKQYLKEKESLDNQSDEENISAGNDDSVGNKRNDCIDALKQFDKGVLPFPYKIAHALDPDLYNNVELEAWNEKVIGKVCDDSSLPLQVGMKCYCKLFPDEEMYQCHIQEIDLETEMSVVFVEEIGEKKSLKLDQLEPLPDAGKIPLRSPQIYYDRGYLTMNQIMNHLRNLKVNNVQKYRNKTKKSVGGTGRDMKVKDQPSAYFENSNYKKHLNKSFTPESVDQNNNLLSEGKDQQRRPSMDDNIDLNNSSCLDEYTHVNYNYFEPRQVEMIAMPIIVEQNADGNENNNSREGPPRSNAASDSNNGALHYSMTLPGMDQNAYVNPPPSSPGTNASAHNAGPSAIILTGSPNGGSPFSPGPVFFMPPSQHQNPMMSMPLPRYCSQLSSSPPTCNSIPQRSVIQNGSDLPYHDVATLRYFFNLGIDWMYFSSGCGSPPAPPPPPPQTPRPASAPLPPLQTSYRQPPLQHFGRSIMVSHPHHQQRFSTNELCVEMQYGLNLEENSNPGGPPDQKKQGANKQLGNNVQKNNGSGRGGRSVVFSSRYRRNDAPQDRNNNKNQYNNQNKGYGNYKPGQGRISKNGDQQQGEPAALDLQSKDDHYSEDSYSSPSERPLPLQFNPDMSFVSYPPPPLYRLPYYSSDSDGSSMSSAYPPQFVSYSHDEMSAQAEVGYSNPVSPLHPHPHFMNVNVGFLPMSQQMFFPQQPQPHLHSHGGYSTYLPSQFSSPAIDGDSMLK